MDRRVVIATKSRSLLYGTKFVVIELGFYFLVFALHAMLLRSYPLEEAMLSGAYAVGWRFLLLQAPMQALAISTVHHFGKKDSLLLLIIAGLIALICSGFFYFTKAASILGLFRMVDLRHLPEGYVLPITIAITWFVMTRLERT